ncbi:MAG: wax ester/triacylglycerol synthase family O-acyltransferase [Acidimicrobiales bacterium]
MQRMHGVDALGIYSETPTSPFTTLKVAIYRPVPPDDAPSAADLRDFVREQVLRLGRGIGDQRIVRVPFDLHHPLWVTDPDYSPDDHIYRAALPAPGDKAQLCDFLSDLMGRPLDPERPLWEAWIVEGLQGGRLAVVVKMHHSLADGATVAELIERSHSTGATESPSGPPGGDAVPGNARLLAGALVDLAKTFALELPDFLRERQLARQERADGHEAAEPPPDLAAEARLPGHAPFTVLNARRGGRYRVYRYETFSLAETKELANAFGCTVNTLLLGVCSEALRRYLADVDEVPASSLLAAMPVGHPGHPPHQTRLHPDLPRNDVAVAVLPLHQDVADFEQRLQLIKRSSDAAVDRVLRAWGKRFDNFLEFLPGALVRRAVNDLSARQQARGKDAYANVIVSNVVGPRQPLFALDGRLELVEVLSTGNITDAGNLNITAWSYVDDLCVSFYMRKGAMPEPDKLPAYLREVYEELQLSAQRSGDAEPAISR